MPLLAEQNKPAPVRRGLTATLAFGLLLALGGLLWLSFQETPGLKRTLANGAVMELTGVTYGKRHEHWDGNWWRRTAPLDWMPVLPFARPATTDILNYEPPLVEHHTATDTLVLWFKTGHNSSGWTETWSAATIDRHGCRLRCRDEGWASLPPGFDFDWRHPRKGSTPSELTAYPRSQAGFRYALVSEQGKPSVELPIWNPAPATAKAWKGAACPISVLKANTRFVLQRLRHRPQGGPFFQAAAKFQYFEGGRAVEAWRPDLVTVLDANGNVLATRQRDFTQNGQATFDALCRVESAWKLRVRFTRADPSATPPDLVWKVRNLPAPRRNHLIQPGKSVKLGDTLLRLDRIAGGGSVSWANGSGTYEYPDVVITADAPAGASLVSLIGCTDQAGRDLYPETWPSGEVIERPEQELEFSLSRYSAATRKLNLTFAVHHTRTVEFLVQP